MDPQYLSRPFSAEDRNDLDGVIRLYSAVFGRDKAARLRKNWKWYNRENPAKKSYDPRSWVIENKGKIVGHISVNPGIMMCDGRKAYFAWGGNLMADPTHRGKGIGKEMVRKWKDEANICLALGVGDVAYGIESSMGWFNVDAAGSLIKPLNTGRFLQFIFRFRSAAKMAFIVDIILNIFFRSRRASDGFMIKRISSFGKEYDLLWKELSKEFPISSIRNSEHLNWKYTKNPSRDFEIFEVRDKTGVLAGYFVASKVSSDNFDWCRVVDIAVSPKDKEAIQSMISFIISHSKSQGCDGIQAYGMHDLHRKMFRKNGFIHMRPMDQRFIVKVDDPGEYGKDMRFFRDEKNWFVTAGDSDFTT